MNQGLKPAVHWWFNCPYPNGSCHVFQTPLLGPQFARGPRQTQSPSVVHPLDQGFPMGPTQKTADGGTAKGTWRFALNWVASRLLVSILSFATLRTFSQLATQAWFDSLCAKNIYPQYPVLPGACILAFACLFSSFFPGARSAISRNELRVTKFGPRRPDSSKGCLRN